MSRAKHNWDYPLDSHKQKRSKKHISHMLKGEQEWFDNKEMPIFQSLISKS